MLERMEGDKALITAKQKGSSWRVIALDREGREVPVQLAAVREVKAKGGDLLIFEVLVGEDVNEHRDAEGEQGKMVRGTVLPKDSLKTWEEAERHLWNLLATCENCDTKLPEMGEHCEWCSERAKPADG